MFTRKFFRATMERGLKTFGQVFGAMLAANGTGLLDADWEGTFSVAGMATLLSVLTSIGSAQFGPGTGPSLTGDEVLTAKPDETQE